MTRWHSFRNYIDCFVVSSKNEPEGISTDGLNKKHLDFFVCFFPIVLGMLILAFFPKWTIDDAYITFRYAKNLAQTGQLTYNIGMPPIEGYTGVFLPVVLSLFMKIGFSPEIMAKIIGGICFFLTNMVIIKFLKSLKIRAGLMFFVLIIFNTMAPSFMHALSGLETFLFTLFLLIDFYLLYKYLYLSKENKTENVKILMILSLLMTSLIRPEGVLLSGMLLLFVMVYNLKASKTKGLKCSLIFGVYWIVFFLLPFAAYVFFKYRYYGYFLPNPYYAKLGSLSSSKTAIEDFFVFSVSSCVVLIYAFINFSKGNIKGIYDDLSNRYAAFLHASYGFLGFVVIVLSKYFSSNLLMNICFRFYFPFFPIFLVIITLVIEIAISGFMRREIESEDKIKKAKKLLNKLIIIQLALNLLMVGYFIRFAFTYKSLGTDLGEKCAASINTLVPKNETLIVWPDAGIIPYKTNLRTIDFGRLNDNFLSRENPSKKEISDYFFNQNAGAVVFSSTKEAEISIHLDDVMPAPKEIIQDPRFSKYIYYQKFSIPKNEYNSVLFIREDLLSQKYFPK